MFVLLRRFVAWSPAAFVGGLLYGFWPFILISLTDAHLMLGLAPIPPLMVACLDELLVRQRHRALPAGLVLGVLVAAQFLVGSEALVITLIAAGIGVVLVVGYGIVRRRRQLRSGSATPSPHWRRPGHGCRPAGLPGVVRPGRAGPSRRARVGGGRPSARGHHPRGLPHAGGRLLDGQLAGPPFRGLPGPDALRPVLRDRPGGRGGRRSGAVASRCRLWLFAAAGGRVRAPVLRPPVPPVDAVAAVRPPPGRWTT